jgi:prepilin-type N-terminal cleavage/methylation domain-containing protein
MHGKQAKGFTLLEVVISIAALALLSIFLLQMFMASSNLNQRAQDSDMALAKTISAIEEVKGWDAIKPDAYENNNAGGFFIYTFYDRDWNLLEDNRQGSQFQLTLELSPESASAGLYAVNATVTDLTAVEDKAVLSYLHTKKYFPISAEGGDVG